MTDIESLCRLTEAVEAAGADIAPTYLEYVQLSFAIATDCGEAGRDFFHRLCRVSPKYQREHAERVFSNALHTQRGEVHLGTAFHLAEATGVSICIEEMPKHPTGTKGTAGTARKFPPHTGAYNKVGNDNISEEREGEEELLPGSEPQHQLPTFPENDWPEFLQRIIKAGSSPIQHDIMLLGALTALGACMSRHVRCLYGGKYHHPSLQCFVVAPSASGKGILSYIRLLVEPIHDEIRKEVAIQMKAYKKEKTEYDAMGKERTKKEAPQMPPNRMFLISGNNTGTGILQNIMDSDGTGLICEAEADTLSTAIGSDHGHWSDTLRKAFDHDRLSYNRRTDREYREVKRSYLSVLLSGTPAQVKPLIPTAENGLFSRQLFYYMPAIHKWQNQFDRQDTDLETVFTGLGMQWREQLKRITAGGLFTLRLTPEQKELFNNLFANLFIRSHLANGSEMASSVARLAINICRIMQVVAMLRVLESDDIARSPHLTPDKDISGDNLKDGIITRWDMTILPADFNSVLELTESLYRHATHILSFLPGTEISRRSNADRDALLQSMEREFTRSAFLMQAEATGIKPGTASTWLKRLVKHGMIESVDGKGTYRKPLPNGM